MLACIYLASTVESGSWSAGCQYLSSPSSVGELLSQEVTTVDVRGCAFIVCCSDPVVSEVR